MQRSVGLNASTAMSELSLVTESVAAKAGTPSYYVYFYFYMWVKKAVHNFVPKINEIIL